MAFSGTFYALSPDHRRGLLAGESDQAVLDYLAEHLTGVPIGAGWDAVHRCLTDGECRTDNGEYPLALAVLGGRQLHDGDEWIVSYVAPGEILALLDALDEIDESDFADRFDMIDEDDFEAPLDDESLKASWTTFVAVRAFYEQAAQQGAAAVFVVEQ